MNITCTKIIKKSQRYNENRYVVNEGFLYAVLQGTCDLHNDEKKKSPISLSSVFADDVKSHLVKYDGHTRLASYLYSISQNENEKFNLGNVEPSYLPSMGIAMACFVDNYVDLYVIGNCEVTIVLTDGRIINLKCSEIEELKKNTVEALVELSQKKHITVRKTVPLINELLIKNRNLMNTDLGYQFFTISDKPQFRFQHKQITSDNIDFIYLYSDGFAQAYTTLGLYKDVQEMFQTELDIEKTTQHIVKLWNKDKNQKKYPRLNAKDDITVIKLKFDN